MDYDRMGNGGMRPATRALNNHAMEYFLKFLESKRITFINSDDNRSSSSHSIWQEQGKILCRKEIWQEYGTYLRDYAKQANGDALSTGTGLNYLGQAKETVRKMYESNDIWRDHELKKGQRLDSLGSERFWFSRIRNQLEKDLNHKHILLGDSLSESSLPLGRKNVAQINKLYLSKGHVSDVEKAAAIITTFGAIGRAGECSFITYAQAEWNSIYDILVLDWNEVKTDKQVPMPFCHDYSEYSLCFYFIMFCYHLCGAGSRFITTQSYKTAVEDRGLEQDESSLIFPFLVTNAAQKVSVIMYLHPKRIKYTFRIYPKRMKYTFRIYPKRIKCTLWIYPKRIFCTFRINPRRIF